MEFFWKTKSPTVYDENVVYDTKKHQKNPCARSTQFNLAWRRCGNNDNHLQTIHTVRIDEMSFVLPNFDRWGTHTPKSHAMGKCQCFNNFRKMPVQWWFEWSGAGMNKKRFFTFTHFFIIFNLSHFHTHYYIIRYFIHFIIIILSDDDNLGFLFLHIIHLLHLV